MVLYAIWALFDLIVGYVGYRLAGIYWRLMQRTRQATMLPKKDRQYTVGLYLVTSAVCLMFYLHYTIEGIYKLMYLWEYLRG